MRIFIDADACPVKDEVYKVAARYGLKTTVVSNSFIADPALEADRADDRRRRPRRGRRLDRRAGASPATS